MIHEILGFVFDSNSGSLTYLISNPGDYEEGQAVGISGQNVVGWFQLDDFRGAYGPRPRIDYVHDGLSYTQVQFPGSTSTTVSGIDGDTIVGNYIDASGQHGFIGTLPEPTGVMPVVAVLGFALARRDAPRRST